jgi:hypothetical protein
MNIKYNRCCNVYTVITIDNKEYNLIRFYDDTKHKPYKLLDKKSLFL